MTNPSIHQSNLDVIAIQTKERERFEYTTERTSSGAKQNLRSGQKVYLYSDPKYTGTLIRPVEKTYPQKWTVELDQGGYEAVNIDRITSIQTQVSTTSHRLHKNMILHLFYGNGTSRTIIMSIILSCVEFLVANLFVYISFQVRDEVGSQVVRILGVLLSLLSFLFSPLLVKSLIVIVLLITLPYISDRISIYFYRQLNK